MGYTQDLVACWDMSVDNPTDICWRGNRYPGTGANIVGHPNGIAGGKCAEFNGNNSNINVGKITELSSVEKFTIAFWMNQDVLDQIDLILVRNAAGFGYVQILTRNTGTLGIEIVNTALGANGTAFFDYSTVISANEWHHLVTVFDGSGAANSDRMKMYVDGIQITLGFTGTITSVLADLSSADTFLGGAVSAFDGKLDEFMIFCSTLTNLQVADLYNRTRQGRF